MVRVFVDKYFLLKFQSLIGSFTVDQIIHLNYDIESILFIKKIFEKNEVHININDIEIKNLIEKGLSYKSGQIGIWESKEDQVLSAMASKYSLKSCDLLYKKILAGNINDLDVLSLPNYLFIGEESVQTCEEIENKYGLHCYSLQRMKIEDKFRNVQLKQIENTLTDLNTELADLFFNEIIISDPFVLASVYKEREKEFKQTNFYNFVNIICNKANKGKRVLSLSANLDYDSNAKTREIEIERDKIAARKYFVRFFEEMKKLGSNIVVRYSDKAKHDRYIVTNTSIIIIGNSILKDSKTHFTLYPIGIYNNMKMQMLKQRI